MITWKSIWRGVVALGIMTPMVAGQCPDQWRLLVTQASSSASGFLVLDADTGTRMGAGPSGYTPAGIAVRSDRDVLVWVQNSGPALLHDGRSYRDLGEFIVQGAGGGLQGRELVIDGDDIYVAGGSSNRVAVFDAATGAYRGPLFPAGAGGVDTCWGLAVRETDVLVASAMTDEVLRYDRATGEFLGAFVTAGSGGLDEPYDVVVGPTEDVFVSSRSQGIIYRYSATGEFLEQFGTVGAGLRGLGFDHRGDLLACSWNGPSGLRSLPV